MKLPRVDEPQRYCGLYVYDFGPWSAVGYTAEEIAILLEDERTAGGKVYRIQRALPDGTMDLRAISADRFGLESGMFFFRYDIDQARSDFRQLAALGNEHRPPCRARLTLADRGPGVERGRYVVSLVFPAEYDDDVAAWLLAHDYAGGDFVEGGISSVSTYLQQANDILERQQLWSVTSGLIRSAEEVLASTRRAVQR